MAAQAQAPALEIDRVTPYLGFLFVLLSTATLFDGFDAAMIGFAAPDVRASLGIDLAQWGLINGITRMGSALPGRISASGPDITVSPLRNPSGARM